VTAGEANVYTIYEPHEQRGRERATLSGGAPASAPGWVREAIEEERKIEHLPERLKKRYRRIRRAQGIGVPPRQASRDIQRRERILQAMAN